MKMMSFAGKLTTAGSRYFATKDDDFLLIFNWKMTISERKMLTWPGWWSIMRPSTLASTRIRGSARNRRRGVIGCSWRWLWGSAVSLPTCENYETCFQIQIQTRNCVSKTRTFALKMMNSAVCGGLPGGTCGAWTRGAGGAGGSGGEACAGAGDEGGTRGDGQGRGRRGGGGCSAGAAGAGAGRARECAVRAEEGGGRRHKLARRRDGCRERRDEPVGEHRAGALLHWALRQNLLLSGFAINLRAQFRCCVCLCVSSYGWVALRMPTVT